MDQALFLGLDQTWLDLFKKNNIKEDITQILAKIPDFKDVYPQPSEIFGVFKLIKPAEIKVIIIGQDPYHGKSQANGIAFSVCRDQKTPPSLRNIFKELQSDLNITRKNNDLQDWVRQGVFLINSCLTVQKNQPASHTDLGWEKVIIKIIDQLCQNNSKLIFCLWGNHAKKIYNNISYQNENVIVSAHPSPFSFKRGFEGSKPFSKINQLLRKSEQKEIVWND